MKKQTKALLVTFLLVVSYILARPYVHITIDDAGAHLFYRDSVSERFSGVTLWK